MSLWPLSDKVFTMWGCARARLEAKMKDEAETCTRPLAVGDLVYTYFGGAVGVVQAVHNDVAWVLLRDDHAPTTYPVGELTRVQKPRVGWTDWLICQSDGNRAWTSLSRFKVIELTDEVRERVKDLL